VLLVGHRGAPALAPENTLASFRLAVEHGVDVVELDVLPGLQLGHDHGSGHLDDALRLFAEELTATGLLVDLKRPGYEEAVVEALRRHGLVERSLVCSLDRASLRRVEGVPRSLSYPDDRRGLSTRAWLDPAVRAALAVLRRRLPSRITAMCADADASAVTLHHGVVSPALVRACPVPIYAWTVDDRELARRLESLGVAAIITNDPRIFASLT
jgi:glycerophosphoryl diester phosphodiesterase